MMSNVKANSNISRGYDIYLQSKILHFLIQEFFDGLISPSNCKCTDRPFQGFLISKDSNLDAGGTIQILLLCHISTPCLLQYNDKTDDSQIFCIILLR